MREKEHQELSALVLVPAVGVVLSHPWELASERKNSTRIFTEMSLLYSRK